MAHLSGRFPPAPDGGEYGISIYAGPHLPGFRMGAPLGPTKSGVPKFRLTQGGLQVAVAACLSHAAGSVRSADDRVAACPSPVYPDLTQRDRWKQPP